MRNTFIILAILVSLPTLLTNCNEPEYPTPTPVTSASTASSNVLVVNAAPGAAALNDLLVDNIPVSGSLPAFAEVYPVAGTATYYAIPAGNRQVRAKVPSVSADVVSSFNYNTGRFYTFFIADTLDRPQDRDRYIVRPLVVSDNLSAPAAGKAKVRFLHLSPNAPQVGVYNAATDAVVFTNRGYRQTSTGSGDNRVDFTAFSQIDAGTYALDVRTAADAAPVLVLPAVTFEPGKIYTVYARGLVGGTGEEALGASIIVHN